MLLVDEHGVEGRHALLRTSRRNMDDVELNLGFPGTGLRVRVTAAGEVYIRASSEAPELTANERRVWAHTRATTGSVKLSSVATSPCGRFLAFASGSDVIVLHFSGGPAISLEDVVLHCAAPLQSLTWRGLASVGHAGCAVDDGHVAVHLPFGRASTPAVLAALTVDNRVVVWRESQSWEPLGFSAVAGPTPVSDPDDGDTGDLTIAWVLPQFQHDRLHWAWGGARVVLEGKPDSHVGPLPEPLLPPLMHRMDGELEEETAKTLDYTCSFPIPHGILSRGRRDSIASTNLSANGQGGSQPHTTVAVTSQAALPGTDAAGNLFATTTPLCGYLASWPVNGHVSAVDRRGIGPDMQGGDVPAQDDAGMLGRLFPSPLLSEMPRMTLYEPSSDFIVTVRRGGPVRGPNAGGEGRSRSGSPSRVHLVVDLWRIAVEDAASTALESPHKARVRATSVSDILPVGAPSSTATQLTPVTASTATSSLASSNFESTSAAASALLHCSRVNGVIMSKVMYARLHQAPFSTASATTVLQVTVAGNAVPSLWPALPSYAGEISRDDNDLDGDFDSDGDSNFDASIRVGTIQDDSKTSLRVDDTPESQFDGPGGHSLTTRPPCVTPYPASFRVLTGVASDLVVSSLRHHARAVSASLLHNAAAAAAATTASEFDSNGRGIMMEGSDESASGSDDDTARGKLVGVPRRDKAVLRDNLGSIASDTETVTSLGTAPGLGNPEGGRIDSAPPHPTTALLRGQGALLRLLRLRPDRARANRAGEATFASTLPSFDDNGLSNGSSTDCEANASTIAAAPRLSATRVLGAELSRQAARLRTRIASALATAAAFDAMDSAVDAGALYPMCAAGDTRPVIPRVAPRTGARGLCVTSRTASLALPLPKTFITLSSGHHSHDESVPKLHLTVDWRRGTLRVCNTALANESNTLSMRENRETYHALVMRLQHDPSFLRSCFDAGGFAATCAAAILSHIACCLRRAVAWDAAVDAAADRARTQRLRRRRRVPEILKRSFRSTATPADGSIKSQSAPLARRESTTQLVDESEDDAPPSDFAGDSTDSESSDSSGDDLDLSLVSRGAIVGFGPPHQSVESLSGSASPLPPSSSIRSVVIPQLPLHVLLNYAAASAPSGHGVRGKVGEATVTEIKREECTTAPAISLRTLRAFFAAHPFSADCAPQTTHTTPTVYPPLLDSTVLALLDDLLPRCASPLPGLTRADMLALLAFVETARAYTATAETARQVNVAVGINDTTVGSDGGAGRVLQAIRLHQLWLQSPLLTTSAVASNGTATGAIVATKVPPFAWTDCLWALRCDSMSLQSTFYKMMLPGDKPLTWADVQRTRFPVWLRSETLLREATERLARGVYLEGGKKDPFDAALPYLALGASRLPTLRALFRLAPGLGKVFQFLSKDFSDVDAGEGSKSRTAASKNAFALIGQHRYAPAAAFFLLAGRPDQAIKTVAMQLHDPITALLVARLAEYNVARGDSFPGPNGVRPPNVTSVGADYGALDVRSLAREAAAALSIVASASRENYRVASATPAAAMQNVGPASRVSVPMRTNFNRPVSILGADFDDDDESGSTDNIRGSDTVGTDKSCSLPSVIVTDRSQIPISGDASQTAATQRNTAHVDVMSLLNADLKPVSADADAVAYVLSAELLVMARSVAFSASQMDSSSSSGDMLASSPSVFEPLSASDAAALEFIALWCLRRPFTATVCLCRRITSAPEVVGPSIAAFAEAVVATPQLSKPPIARAVAIAVGMGMDKRLSSAGACGTIESLIPDSASTTAATSTLPLQLTAATSRAFLSLGQPLLAWSSLCTGSTRSDSITNAPEAVVAGSPLRRSIFADLDTPRGDVTARAAPLNSPDGSPDASTLVPSDVVRCAENTLTALLAAALRDADGHISAAIDLDASSCAQAITTSRASAVSERHQNYGDTTEARHVPDAIMSVAKEINVVVHSILRVSGASVAEPTLASPYLARSAVRIAIQSALQERHWITAYVLSTDKPCDSTLVVSTTTSLADNGSSYPMPTTKSVVAALLRHSWKQLCISFGSPSDRHVGVHLSAWGLSAPPKQAAVTLAYCAQSHASIASAIVRIALLQTASAASVPAVTGSNGADIDIEELSCHAWLNLILVATIVRDWGRVLLLLHWGPLGRAPVAPLRATTTRASENNLKLPLYARLPYALRPSHAAFADGLAGERTSDLASHLENNSEHGLRVRDGAVDVACTSLEDWLDSYADAAFTALLAAAVTTAVGSVAGTAVGGRAHFGDGSLQYGVRTSSRLIRRLSAWRRQTAVAFVSAKFVARTRVPFAWGPNSGARHIIITGLCGIPGSQGDAVTGEQHHGTGRNATWWQDTALLVSHVSHGSKVHAADQLCTPWEALWSWLGGPGLLWTVGTERRALARAATRASLRGYLPDVSTKQHARVDMRDRGGPTIFCLDMLHGAVLAPGAAVSPTPLLLALDQWGGVAHSPVRTTAVRSTASHGATGDGVGNDSSAPPRVWATSGALALSSLRRDGHHTVHAVTVRTRPGVFGSTTPFTPTALPHSAPGDAGVIASPATQRRSSVPHAARRDGETHTGTVDRVGHISHGAVSSITAASPILRLPKSSPLRRLISAVASGVGIGGGNSGVLPRTADADTEAALHNRIVVDGPRASSLHAEPVGDGGMASLPLSHCAGDASSINITPAVVDAADISATDRYDYAKPFTLSPSAIAAHPFLPVYARGGPEGAVVICGIILERVGTALPPARRASMSASSAVHRVASGIANSNVVASNSAAAGPGADVLQYVHRLQRILPYRPLPRNASIPPPPTQSLMSSDTSRLSTSMQATSVSEHARSGETALLPSSTGSRLTALATSGIASAASSLTGLASGGLSALRVGLAAAGTDGSGRDTGSPSPPTSGHLASDRNDASAIDSLGFTPWAHLDEEVLRLRWSSDGAAVAACFASGVVRVWDAVRATSHPKHTLSTSGAHTLQSAGVGDGDDGDAAQPFRGEHVVWAATDAAFLTRSPNVLAASAAPIFPRRFRDPAVHAAQIHSGGSSRGVVPTWTDLALTGWGLHVFDLRCTPASPVVAAVRYPEDAGVTSLAWDVCGTAILAGCEDGSLLVYDVRCGRVRVRVPGVPLTAAVRTVILPHELHGRRHSSVPVRTSRVEHAASNGVNDMPLPTTPFALPDHYGHAGAVRHVALHANQRILVSGGADGDVRLWSLPELKHCATLPRVHAAVNFRLGEHTDNRPHQQSSDETDRGNIGVAGDRESAGLPSWAAQGGVAGLVVLEDAIVSGGFDGSLRRSLFTW